MRCRGVILGVLLAAVPSARGTEGVDQLSRFLEERGILRDRTQALRGAVEGLLKTVDPEARFCTAEEAARWRAGGDGRGAAESAQAVEKEELWPENIAYLKVREVSPGCGEKILARLRTLDNRPGIIVDLRGAGGDDLQSVVSLASPFYGTGDALFFLSDNRGVTVSTNTAQGSAPVSGFIMVLTDGSTRQAAESLAAVWRGCPGIMVIGGATRGDSRVRELLSLPDGRFLYVATRRMIPARGADYEGQGVQPDVVVAVSGAREAVLAEPPPSGKPLSAKSIQDRDLMRRVGGDVVLRRATDILLGLRALDGYGKR